VQVRSGRAEAFSIRRLEGSRWCLRGTRVLWSLNRNVFNRNEFAVPAGCKTHGRSDRSKTLHSVSDAIPTRNLAQGLILNLAIKWVERHAKRPPRQRVRSSRQTVHVVWSLAEARQKYDKPVSQAQSGKLQQLGFADGTRWDPNSILGPVNFRMMACHKLRVPTQNSEFYPSREMPGRAENTDCSIA
jgi:hypothetical protein